MRDIWNMYHAYSGTLGSVGRTVFGATAHYLRLWDTVTAGGIPNDP